MADDKSKRDGRDRAKVNKSENYEVQYEAKKTGRSSSEVKAAVSKVGNSRKKVESELRAKKK